MQFAQALIKILLLFRMLILLTGKTMPHRKASAKGLQARLKTAVSSFSTTMPTTPPAALSNILKCLKDEGYEFVFISDLIYKDNYEIKHDGTQCKINR